MKQSDADLLQRVRVGDENAFTILISRHREPLLRHIAQLVRDQSTAEDILQEVFLRVWTRAGQWHETGSCRRWMYAIATNMALNWLRTVRRRLEQPLKLTTFCDDEDNENSMPGWWLEANYEGPEQVAEAAELRRHLGRLVGQLPKEKRETIRLVYEHELEPQEVAQVLNVPPGTVRSRLYNARKRLALLWKADKWEV